jgi:hypothetical protein
MVGPDGGVKAVEMTLATQPEPAAALRTVIDSDPPVTVTVAVVGRRSSHRL